MEKLMSQDVEKQIKDILSNMIQPVKLVLFTRVSNEPSDLTEQLLGELSALNNKIQLEVHDINITADLAKTYDITDAPSFVILDHNNEDRGVKFSGIPLGHEINSLLSAIMEMSGVDFGYDSELIEKIKKINKPVNIKVFVTMSCPHCPGAVQSAHRLAMLNDNIKAEMIEAQTYYELSTKYNVTGVPKIVINDKYELLGNQPVEAFLKEIAKI